MICVFVLIRIPQENFKILLLKSERNFYKEKDLGKTMSFGIKKISYPKNKLIEKQVRKEIIKFERENPDYQKKKELNP